MKIRSRRSQLVASVSLEAEPPLSPMRAFVVQFREETGTVRMRFTGRVEHMTSGHATRFHSPKELLAFFAHALSTTREKPP